MHDSEQTYATRWIWPNTSNQSNDGNSTTPQFFGGDSEAVVNQLARFGEPEVAHLARLMPRTQSSQLVVLLRRVSFFETVSSSQGKTT